MTTINKMDPEIYADLFNFRRDQAGFLRKQEVAFDRCRELVRIANTVADLYETVESNLEIEISENAIITFSWTYWKWQERNSDCISFPVSVFLGEQDPEQYFRGQRVAEQLKAAAQKAREEADFIANKERAERAQLAKLKEKYEH